MLIGGIVITCYFSISLEFGANSFTEKKYDCVTIIILITATVTANINRNIIIVLTLLIILTKGDSEAEDDEHVMGPIKQVTEKKI